MGERNSSLLQLRCSVFNDTKIFLLTVRNKQSSWFLCFMSGWFYIIIPIYKEFAEPDTGCHGCLQRQESSRLTLEEVLSHPWISGTTLDKIETENRNKSLKRNRNYKNLPQSIFSLFKCKFNILTAFKWHYMEQKIVILKGTQ